MRVARKPEEIWFDAACVEAATVWAGTFPQGSFGDCSGQNKDLTEMALVVVPLVVFV
jgi:hypothetical protein